MIDNSINGFGVIADDLTGAMDAGAGFLRKGLHPFVKLGSWIHADSDTVIINTNSRDMTPDAAYRTVRRRAKELAGLYVFKKIDSTFRGNVGQEITGVMEALKLEKAIVCPAFPENGRTVVNGKLLVGNVPVNETSFADDPAYPVKESFVPELLHNQTALPVGLIALEEIDRGADNIFTRISQSRETIIAADAVNERHLMNLAQALSRMPGSWLPCGSGGLAREIPAAFGYRQQADNPFIPEAKPKPALAVVGSRNSISREQVKAAETSPSIHVIRIEPVEFVDDRGRLKGLGDLVKEATGFIQRGQNVLLTTSFSRYGPSLTETSARLLARIVAITLRKFELSGLFLTGGDIAMETCHALGVTGIRILNEIEPGIILGEAIGTRHGDVKIITKAGGFGRDRTIVDAVHYLGGER